MMKRTSNGSTGHRKGKVQYPSNRAALHAHQASMAVIQGKFSKEVCISLLVYIIFALHQYHFNSGERRIGEDAAAMEGH